MHLRHPGLLQSASASDGRSPTPTPEVNNPDSSNARLDAAEDSSSPKEAPSPSDGSVNLTISKAKKAAVTLVKQKDDDDVTSSDKSDSIGSKQGAGRGSATRHSDVWRPY